MTKNFNARLIAKILLFIVTVLCMSAIFMFSSQSGEKSNDISFKLTEKIADSSISGGKVGETYEEHDNFNGIIRKSAHFTMFFLLGLSSAAFAQLSFKSKYVRLLYPLGLSLMWAVIDEIHQYFVPGRTGLATDVLIDFLGALLATVIVVLSTWGLRKIKNR